MASQRSPVTFQTRDSTTKPPSSGRPGSRLNPATNTLEKANAQASSDGMSATSACSSSQPTPASRRFPAGPATAMSAAVPGRRLAVPNTVCPPQRLATIRSTRLPVARAAMACPASCTNTDTNSSSAYAAATAYPVAPGSAPASCGPKVSTTTTAMTGHERPTYTGMPPTRPSNQPYWGSGLGLMPGTLRHRPARGRTRPDRWGRGILGRRSQPPRGPS